MENYFRADKEALVNNDNTIFIIIVCLYVVFLFLLLLANLLTPSTLLKLC